MYSSPNTGGIAGLRTCINTRVLPVAFAISIAAASAGREATEKSLGCTMRRLAIFEVSREGRRLARA